MILKTVCALLAFILEQFGVYGDGEFKWYYGWVLYTMMESNIWFIMVSGIINWYISSMFFEHPFVFSINCIHWLILGKVIFNFVQWWWFSKFWRYPYIAVVMNFSQMWALYCLVQFYNVTHERLQPIQPLAKFISFKAIVFATWWQGVGIAVLCTFGVLPNEGKFQTGLQDFLICIEVIN